MRDMDGIVIKIGESVAFKDDHEQDGKVIRFERGFVVLSVYDSHTVRSEEKWVQPDRIWHD